MFGTIKDKRQTHPKTWSREKIPDCRNVYSWGGFTYWSKPPRVTCGEFLLILAGLQRNSGLRVFLAFNCRLLSKEPFKSALQMKLNWEHKVINSKRAERSRTKTKAVRWALWWRQVGRIQRQGAVCTSSSLHRFVMVGSCRGCYSGRRSCLWREPV